MPVMVSVMALLAVGRRGARAFVEVEQRDDVAVGAAVARACGRREARLGALDRLRRGRRRRRSRADGRPVLDRGEEVGGDSIAGRVAAAVVAVDGRAQIDARQIAVREVHLLLRRDHVVRGHHVGDRERRDLLRAVAADAEIRRAAQAAERASARTPRRRSSAAGRRRARVYRRRRGVCGRRGGRRSRRRWSGGRRRRARRLRRQRAGVRGDRPSNLPRSRTQPVSAAATVIVRSNTRKPARRSAALALREDDRP